MDFLPKRLLEFRNKPPLFFACQFSAAPCRTWRTKGDKSGSVRRPEQSEPGNGILVDHIVSDQPGMIPQISGFRNSQLLWGCTTFMDHVSDFVYVHLMRDLFPSEILLDKEALEKLMAQSGQTVNHYHSDNSKFYGNGFIGNINQKDQNITYFVVGAHHQNSIVKNKNKILTTGARTLLIHGMRIWPQMIDKIFCPFAIKSVS